jgi:hypothetical protein
MKRRALLVGTGLGLGSSAGATPAEVRMAIDKLTG